MLTMADDDNMSIDLFAAPSDLRIPERTPSIMMNGVMMHIGTMYALHRSDMDRAPIMTTRGSMRT